MLRKKRISGFAFTLLSITALSTFSCTTKPNDGKSRDSTANRDSSATSLKRVLRAGVFNQGRFVYLGYSDVGFAEPLRVELDYKKVISPINDTNPTVTITVQPTASNTPTELDSCVSVTNVRIYNTINSQLNLLAKFQPTVADSAHRHLWYQGRMLSSNGSATSPFYIAYDGGARAIVIMDNDISHPLEIAASKKKGKP